MYEEEQFKYAYDRFITQANDLLENQNIDVLMVAAVMSTIGMSLYRTALSEEDYNKMVEAMFDLKGEIQTLGPKEMLH